MSDECSGYLKGSYVCKHGHPQSFACHSPRQTGILPVCLLDEPGELHWVAFYDADTGHTKKYLMEDE